MPGKCSVFIAMSLDGFIARQDGAIDWLDEASASTAGGDDHGYSDFIAQIDAVVIGRKTYEKVLSFGGWAYGGMPVTVLSRGLSSLAPGLPDSARLTQGEPSALVDELHSMGMRRLYIDGGLTIQGFLAAGLIDELTITVIPVLLGSGLPLFGPLPFDVHLELLSTRALSSGFVQLVYRVVRNA